MSEPGAAGCVRCGRPLSRAARFTLAKRVYCLGCALQHGPLLRRSGLTALVVGTVLVAINQGGALLSGHPPATLIWQIPLTYAVPFCVATWGALTSARG